MTTVRTGAKRRWVKWGVVSALLLSLPAFLFLTEEYYYRIERIDMTYWKSDLGLSDADLERAWNHEPATSAEIEGYLHDATLVGRSRFNPKAAEAIYVGTRHAYIRWEEGQPTSTGHWRTRWRLEHRVWGARSKWQVAQVFCFDVTRHEDLGFCIDVYDYWDVFVFDKQPQRTPGNPLGIRPDTTPPSDFAARVDRLGLIDAPERKY